MDLVKEMRDMGYSDEDIRAVETNPERENISKIIEESNSFEDALENLKKAYPGIDAAKLKKLCESSDALPPKAPDSDSEEMVDLEDDSLEAIAGGSIGSWFKKKWKIIVGTVVAGPAGAVVGDLLSTKQKQQSIVGASSATKEEEERGEKTENGTVL